MSGKACTIPVGGKLQYSNEKKLKKKQTKLMERSTIFWTRRLTVIKIPVLLNLIYGFIVPNKVTASYFVDINKLILMFVLI